MKKTTTRIKRTTLAGLIVIGVFFGVWFGKDNETEEEEEEEPPEICLTSTEDLLEPFVLTTVNDIGIRPGATESSIKAVTEVRENSVAIREAEEARIAEEKRLAEEKRIAEEARLAAIERERIAEEERKQAQAAKEKSIPSNTKDTGGGWQTFEGTYYGADCYGCSGITATGLDVRNTIYAPSGHRVIAVDPRQIPLGSIVEVSTPGGTFTAVAADTGGAIKGRIIDILVSSEAESVKHGRHNVKLRIIN